MRSPSPSNALKHQTNARRDHLMAGSAHFFLVPPALLANAFVEGHTRLLTYPGSEVTAFWGLLCILELAWNVTCQVGHHRV
ncbi:hypothetical protein ACQKWADRAFT_282351 [Trichoderma austrokoningii]